MVSRGASLRGRFAAQHLPLQGEAANRWGPRSSIDRPAREERWPPPGRARQGGAMAPWLTNQRCRRSHDPGGGRAWTDTGAREPQSTSWRCCRSRYRPRRSRSRRRPGHPGRLLPPPDFPRTPRRESARSRGLGAEGAVDWVEVDAGTEDVHRAAGRTPVLERHADQGQSTLRRRNRPPRVTAPSAPPRGRRAVRQERPERDGLPFPTLRRARMAGSARKSSSSWSSIRHTSATRAGSAA